MEVIGQLNIPAPLLRERTLVT